MGERLTGRTDRQTVIHGNRRRVLLMALFFSFSIGVHFAYAKTFKWLAYTTGGREFWLLLKVSRAANSGTRSMCTVFHVVHDKEDAFIFMPPGRVFVFFLVSHRLPTYSCKVQSNSSQQASQHSSHYVLSLIVLSISYYYYSFASWTAAIDCCLDSSTSIFTTSARRDAYTVGPTKVLSCGTQVPTTK